MEGYKKFKCDIAGERISQIQTARMLGWGPSLLSKYLNGWRPMRRTVENQIRTTIKKLKERHEIS